MSGARGASRSFAGMIWAVSSGEVMDSLWCIGRLLFIRQRGASSTSTRFVTFRALICDHHLGPAGHGECPGWHKRNLQGVLITYSHLNLVSRVVAGSQRGAGPARRISRPCRSRSQIIHIDSGKIEAPQVGLNRTWGCSGAERAIGGECTISGTRRSSNDRIARPFPRGFGDEVVWSKKARYTWPLCRKRKRSTEPWQTGRIQPGRRRVLRADAPPSQNPASAVYTPVVTGCTSGLQIFSPSD